jgi:hypothetical protein
LDIGCCPIIRLERLWETSKISAYKRKKIRRGFPPVQVQSDTIIKCFSVSYMGDQKKITCVFCNRTEGRNTNSGFEPTTLVYFRLNIL